MLKDAFHRNIGLRAVRPTGVPPVENEKAIAHPVRGTAGCKPAGRTGWKPVFRCALFGESFIDDMTGNSPKAECSSVPSRFGQFHAGLNFSSSKNPRARLWVVRTWRRIAPDLRPPASNPGL